MANGELNGNGQLWSSAGKLGMAGMAIALVSVVSWKILTMQETLNNHLIENAGKLSENIALMRSSLDRQVANQQRMIDIQNKTRETADKIQKTLDDNRVYYDDILNDMKIRMDRNYDAIETRTKGPQGE